MNRRTKALGIIAGAATIGVASAIYTSTRRKYSGIKLKKSIIIDRPASELYAFWRNFENLPQIVDMLESVEVRDDKRSHWTALGPGNSRWEWDAEITTDRQNEMIGWRSIDDSTIETAGYVRFERAPGGRGTLVRVALEYNPPAGRAGAAITSIFGKRPGGHIQDALHRLRQRIETGEMARV
jgi:uncharacterized membrane protein